MEENIASTSWPENSSRILSLPIAEQSLSCPKQSLPKSLHEMGYRNTIPNWNNLIARFKRIDDDDILIWCKNTDGNVEVKIGESVFLCHRLVLSAYSNYFKLRSTATKIVVSDQTIAPGAFYRLYKWMLDNTERVDCDGIMELIKTAVYFEVPIFLEFCWKIFSNEEYFCEDVAFMVYFEARQYDFPELKEVMLKRVRKFFIILTSTEEFLLLTATELGVLISSNYIEVNMESEIFFSVIHWLDYNWMERRNFLLPLMQCIRFNTMPAPFLLHLFHDTNCEEVQRVIEHEEVHKLIQNGLGYSVAKESCPLDGLREMITKLKLPYRPRYFIFDPACSYHHRSDCDKKTIFTYDIYLNYLEKLQNASTSYWKTFITSDDPRAQCCNDKEAYDVEFEKPSSSKLLGKNRLSRLNANSVTASSASSLQSSISDQSQKTDQNDNDTDTTESWFKKMKFCAKHLS